jgi:hypothetical protein
MPRVALTLLPSYFCGCTSDRERLAALNLWLRSVRNPGESWWNETIDGLPVQIREKYKGYEYSVVSVPQM